MSTSDGEEQQPQTEVYYGTDGLPGVIAAGNNFGDVGGLLAFLESLGDE